MKRKTFWIGRDTNYNLISIRDKPLRKSSGDFHDGDTVGIRVLSILGISIRPGQQVQVTCNLKIVKSATIKRKKK